MKIESVRSEFTALNQVYCGKTPVFFDGPGGAQVPNCVLTAMVEYLGKSNANLGGAYFSSLHTQALMQSARQAAVDLYHAESTDNIVFGANATSLTFSMSRAIANTWQAGDEIIVTALDHYSNVSPWVLAAEEKGVVVKQLPVVEDNCTLDMHALAELVTPKTRLLAITYASNTTGSVVDIQKATNTVKAHSDALVYVDAVHFAPHGRIDVQLLGCDFLVSSAYKYFGPHLGILYGKAEHLASLNPYKVAPAKNVNPNRWETGTQSFEALAGFVAAVDYLASLAKFSASMLPDDISRAEKLDMAYANIHEWEAELSSYFLQQLQTFPSVKLYGLQHATDRTPTFAFRIDGVAPRQVSEFFAEHAVCIWDGNFYAQGLYNQLGLSDKGGVVRVGCMHYNTIQEIDHFFDLLQVLIKQENNHLV